MMSFLQSSHPRQPLKIVRISRDRAGDDDDNERNTRTLRGETLLWHLRTRQRERSDERRIVFLEKYRRRFRIRTVNFLSVGIPSRYWEEKKHYTSPLSDARPPRLGKILFIAQKLVSVIVFRIYFAFSSITRDPESALLSSRIPYIGCRQAPNFVEKWLLL